MQVSRAETLVQTRNVFWDPALIYIASKTPDLDAHYAKLMAEAGNGESSSALKDEPGSSRAGSLGPGTNDDGDDDMEAVDTSGNKAEDIEALKNTMVQGTSIRLWKPTIHFLTISSCITQLTPRKCAMVTSPMTI